jgi:hypothetical protein
VLVVRRPLLVLEEPILLVLEELVLPLLLEEYLQ